MPPPPKATGKPARTTGLNHWMKQVLEECDHASANFDADAVHDLRVALRRCRSMADGLRAIDPDPEWKAMKKAGKQLFQRLGDLRDVQVMMEWIEKVHPISSSTLSGDSHASSSTTPEQYEQSSSEQNSKPASGAPPNSSRDSVAQTLLDILSEREKEQKREARSALEEFDRKQWRQWSKSLPMRAAKIRPGSALFKHLALERWTEARQLHATALRNRSQSALHALRIGIKRFRYIVENFLPAEHKTWSEDLKHMQDMLGEIHDLDVLWSTAQTCHVFPDQASRNSWHARILEERNTRIISYREKMVGSNSLWHVWRDGLPKGRQVQVLATRRMKLWANTLDPDFVHSEHVATLALELFDGLRKGEFLPSLDGDARSALQIAALLHDVGKFKGNKGHHKASLELIKSCNAPLGWKTGDMRRAATIARFHCGALPTRSHKALRDLQPDEQKITIQLAAILRLANALDAAHDGQIRKVTVEKETAGNHHAGRPACVVVEAEGYSSRNHVARTTAAERYLLETVLRRPVLIKPMKIAADLSS
ncbi:MAG TPA: CHAD domain-containing protein [Candidatus Sulfotelmatobacter sp.]